MSSTSEKKKLLEASEKITVEEVVQLIRTCSVNQVTTQLRLYKQNRPDLFASMAVFYHKASKRK